LSEAKQYKNFLNIYKSFTLQHHLPLKTGTCKTDKIRFGAPGSYVKVGLKAPIWTIFLQRSYCLDSPIVPSCRKEYFSGNMKICKNTCSWQPLTVI